MILYYIWNVLTLGYPYVMKIAMRKALLEVEEQKQRAVVQAFASKATA